jgi:hypothetical protein
MTPIRHLIKIRKTLVVDSRQMEGRVDAVSTKDVLFLLHKESLIWQNQIQVNRKDEETLNV